MLARMIHTAWIFEEKWDAKVCLVHEFGKLVHLAGLTDMLNEALKTSAAAGGEFAVNWMNRTGCCDGYGTAGRKRMNRTGCCDGYGTTGRKQD
jgi:hypothetical protein